MVTWPLAETEKESPTKENPSLLTGAANAMAQAECCGGGWVVGGFELLQVVDVRSEIRRNQDEKWAT